MSKLLKKIKQEPCLPLILAVGLIFRIYNLGFSPGYYPDECHYIEFANNIIHAKFAWGLFTHTYLPRLPLPLVCMGLFCTTFGEDLLSIRLFSVLCSMTTMVLVYLFVQPITELKYKWIIPLVYAVWPPSIYFSRWGFTYNLLQPLFVLLIIQGAWTPLKPIGKSYIALTFVTAAAMLTEPLGIIALLYGVVLHLGRRFTDLIRYLGYSLAPLLIYIILLYLFKSDLLMGDIKSILGERLASEGMQGSPIAYLGRTLFDTYGWILIVSILGLCLLPEMARNQIVIFLMIATVVLSSVSGEDGTLIIRESIILLPLMAIGIGVFCCSHLPLMIKTIHKVQLLFFQKLTPDVFLGEKKISFYWNIAPVLSRLLLFITGLLLLWIILLVPARSLIRGFITPLDHLCVNDTQAMKEATTFLKTCVRREDLVLGDCLPQALPCHVSTVMQMAVRCGSEGNPFFPFHLFQDRVFISKRAENVKYLVLTPFTKNIETLFPGVRQLLERYSDWPEVFTKGEIRILKNPNEG